MPTMNENENIFRIELPDHKKRALLALLEYINEREKTKRPGNLKYHTDKEGRTMLWEATLFGGVTKSQ